MDSKTTIGQVRKKIIKLEKARGWNSDAKNLAISISLEVAELLEHFQWNDNDKVVQKAKDNPSKKEEIEMEIADIFIYMTAFMERLDIDLSHAVKLKMKKIDEKYPADKIRSGGDEYYMQQKMKYRGK